MTGVRMTKVTSPPTPGSERSDVADASSAGDERMRAFAIAQDPACSGVWRGARPWFGGAGREADALARQGRAVPGAELCVGVSQRFLHRLRQRRSVAFD